jgi:hypothetical protein
MKTSTAILVRIGICVLISMAAGFLINEGSNLFLTDPSSRGEPRRVEIVIPNGTAQKIASGQSEPSIPNQLTLTEGDILVIKNEDLVSHQLGPVWVPPQSSGVMQLGGANDYAYTCSFQPSQYEGINVQQRLTTWMRFQGMIAIAMPSSAMLVLYSFLVFPLHKKAKTLQGSAG